MNISIRLFVLTSAFIMLFGCTSAGKQYHKSKLPDPSTFNAHFDDMDSSGDEIVSWPEFKSYFQNAELDVYEALDLNNDGLVDHDEWHKFKEAHGIKHH